MGGRGGGVVSAPSHTWQAERELQRYFDATLEALPSDAERAVYCRALAMDLLHKRERAVPQTRTLRHGKTVAP